MTDDPLVRIREAMDAVAMLPPTIPDPIKLTCAQLDIIVDAAILDPDPPWRTKVNEITGRRIELVETVEESTPYAMGWLGRA